VASVRVRIRTKKARRGRKSEVGIASNTPLATPCERRTT
jgi:hypothetical protein